MDWLASRSVGATLKFFRKYECITRMAGNCTGKLIRSASGLEKRCYCLPAQKTKERRIDFRSDADELEKTGIELLPAKAFLESSIAGSGLICRPKLSRPAASDIIWLGYCQRRCPNDVGKP